MKMINSITCHFQRFQTFAINRMVPSSVLEKDSLFYWRVRILFAIIFTGLLISFFVFVPVVAMVIKGKLWGLLIFDGTVWLIGLGLLFIHGLKYDIRARIALLMLYLTGLVIIISVGPLSGGPAWLFAFAVLVGVLLGSKAAIIALIVNGLTLTIVGWTITAGLFGQAFPFFNNIEKMIVAGANFMLLNMIAAMSVAVLVKGLISSHQKERDLTSTLKREQLHLIEMNNELESEVEERKQAEEAFQESENKYRLLAENVTDIIWTTDMNLNFTYYSPSVFQLQGFTPEEAKVRTMEESMTAGSYALVMRVFTQEMERIGKQKRDPNSPISLELELFRKDGSSIIAEVQANLMLSSDGQPEGIIGITRDITDRIKIETALRVSEKKYRSIMESMKDAAYISSPELRIAYMNPKMISRVGHDATGELCHKAIYDSDEKCAWCVFDQVQRGEHVECELANPKDNRYYSVTNSPISHSEGSIAQLTIFRDITENKAIESQLRQARKMESIGTLTGGIAHDFNNLLYIITGNAELALEDIPEWNTAHANLEEIKAAGLRAAGIVKQLLNFSRKTDQELKPIGVITVIKDVLKFLRSTIPTTIEIRKHLPDTDVVILADPVQINQIMMNLCINASQAMEETGGILEITVENVTLDEEVVDSYPNLTRGDHVKLTVSDTGPGIDPEIIDRICDPYFTTKEVGKGSGMGLAVVLGIVKNHDGALTVDSEPGKGSTFNILFSVVAKKPEAETETTDELPLGSETILFVDDEESIANMTQKMLERLGYAVETRLNPVEALELFQTKPHEFDLVITDMTMPHMTGVKLSEKLKEIRLDIPVIISTGHSSLIDEKRAKEMGVAASVMKPTVMHEIAKTIRKVLDEAQGSGQG